MKWVAAILMILNVVIFLGVSDRQVEKRPELAANRPDVNRESMLLLRETAAASDDRRDSQSSTVVRAPELDGMDGTVAGELDAQNLALINSRNVDGYGLRDGAIPPLGADQDAVAPPTTSPEVGRVDITSVDEDVTAPAPPQPVENGDGVVAAIDQPEVTNPAPDSSRCYRVGPFKDPSLWREATRWAESRGLVFKPVRSQSRELRAVRVYVGPFKSISAAQPKVDVLKQKELDYFVYLHDSDEARISLGYFTQEELATKFVEYLNSQDIAARSQPEYRTLGPFDWMDIDISTTARSRVVDRDWGDDAVLVRERECEFG